MIALDSNVFIYFFEKNQTFYSSAEKIMLKVLSGETKACCSSIIITEIIAGNPLFDPRALLIKSLHIVDVTPEIAHKAGVLRNLHNIKTVDSLHIATAMDSGAQELITNDKKLTKLNIKGLSIHGL